MESRLPSRENVACIHTERQEADELFTQSYERMTSLRGWLLVAVSRNTWSSARTIYVF